MTMEGKERPAMNDGGDASELLEPLTLPGGEQSERWKNVRSGIWRWPGMHLNSSYRLVAAATKTLSIVVDMAVPSIRGVL